MKVELRVKLNITESCDVFADFLNVDTLAKELVKVTKTEKNINGKTLTFLHLLKKFIECKNKDFNNKA